MKKETARNEKQTANLQLVKETNKTLVFNLIYGYGPLSRAEIAKMTRLSPTTVSSLVAELLEEDVIIETGMGTSATSGRKPILLEINPNGGYVVSFEMLEDGFKCYLYDLLCNEKAGVKIKAKDYADIEKDMFAAMERIFCRKCINEKKLFGICISIPALFDADSHKIITSTVLPVQEGNEFILRIREKYPETPLVVENESNLYAYAEKAFGTSAGTENLVFIDIGAGIGAGIILDGKMFTGAGNMAGEIGHMTIDINGTRCKCGNRGCLEVMASVPAITQRIIFGIMSGRDTIVRDLAGNDLNRIDMEIVGKAFAEGDPYIVEVIDEIAARLAAGINNIINVLNPRVIVIGGEITKLGDLFLDMVRAKISMIALKPGLDKVELRYSSVKGNMVTMGGARYVLDKLFMANGFPAAQSQIMFG